MGYTKCFLEDATSYVYHVVVLRNSFDLYTLCITKNANISNRFTQSFEIISTVF